LTDIDFEVPSFRFTAMDSAAGNIESASLIFDPDDAEVDLVEDAGPC